MPQGVFAGSQTHNGGFRADQIKVSFGGVSVRGLLVQSINFSFQQQVTMLYEVGSNFVYYVGGRAQGTAAVSHIIGPSKFGQKLAEKFRDLCLPQDITFIAAAGCADTRGDVRYTLTDAVLVGLAVGVTAQDVVINRNLNFMYIDLETVGGEGAPPANVAGVPNQGGVIERENPPVLDRDGPEPPLFEPDILNLDVGGPNSTVPFRNPNADVPGAEVGGGDFGGLSSGIPGIGDVSPGTTSGVGATSGTASDFGVPLLMTIERP